MKKFPLNVLPYTVASLYVYHLALYCTYTTVTLNLVTIVLYKGISFYYGTITPWIT